MSLETGAIAPSTPPSTPPPPPPQHPAETNDDDATRPAEARQSTSANPGSMPHRGQAAGLSPAAVEIVAGLSAGTVATLVVHPLDIVKTRMQISKSSSATPSTSTMAILRALASNNRPVASLYRGLTPNLTGNALSWASFFFFKSHLERLVAAAAGRPHGLPTPADYFVASALGGAATTVLTNPVWVLKTRMLSSDRGASGAYPSMLAGARAIVSTEGLAGFYRGLGVSLFGVSHGAVQFAVYEPAKRFYFTTWKQRKNEASMTGAAAATVDAATAAIPSGPMSTEATIVISSCAKLVAGAVTYPYQVLRSRLQNIQADDRFGRGFRGVVRRTWKEEGIRGFYRGLVPGVVRVMPATWVTFLVYENVRFHLPRWTA